MNTMIALPIAAAVPTAAPEFSALSDPIFAALDTWQRCQAAMDAVPHAEDYPDEIGDRCWAACTAVMNTRPTTPEGLAALTGWLRQQVPILHGMHQHEIAAVTATIDDATRGMAGLQPWSAPLEPVSTSDKALADAAAGMIATDEAIEQMHRDHTASGSEGDADESEEYQDLQEQRDDHIATLIGTRATSSYGTRAKASAVRHRTLIEDGDVHQQVAVSLAEDLTVIEADPLCRTTELDQLWREREAMIRVRQAHYRIMDAATYQRQPEIEAREEELYNEYWAIHHTIEKLAPSINQAAASQSSTPALKCART